MKYKFLYIAITLLIIINVVILLIPKQKNSVNENAIYYGQFYKTLNYIQQENENLIFTPLLYMGKDTNSLISLNELSNKEILIYYFSAGTCPPCLNTALEALQNNFPDYPTNPRILFLSNDLEYRLRDNYYGKQVSCCKNLKLNLTIEEINAPTFFIVTPDKKIHNVFISDKSIPDLTNQYLYLIKNRYFLP